MAERHEIENPRVVSDLSRFEFEKHAPRQRSRNTTPTSLNTSLRFPTVEQFYDHYASIAPRPLQQDAASPYPITDKHDEGKPYEPSLPHSNTKLDIPPSSSSIQFNYAPPVPPKDKRQVQNVDPEALPAVEDVRDYARAKRGSGVGQKPPRTLSTDFTASEIELVGIVMHRPILSYSRRQNGRGTFANDPRNRIYLTTSNLIDIVQVCFSIAIITFASILSSTDNNINVNIYRYIIATGVVLLLTSVLFLTKTIKFDKCYGALYCIFTCIISAVGLVLALTTFGVNHECARAHICHLRKALAAFSVLSSVLWICLLVVYLTALAISKMIHNDKNF